MSGIRKALCINGLLGVLPNSFAHTLSGLLMIRQLLNHEIDILVGRAIYPRVDLVFMNFMVTTDCQLQLVQILEITYIVML